MPLAPVQIERVYVQAEGGVRSNEAFYKAWEGFRKRGVACELFEADQLFEGRLSLTPTTLVAGGLRVVEEAFRRLGVGVPDADGLPESLARFRGRKVWTSTWGALRSRYAQSGPPVPLFVKPLRRNKGFPALALYDADDVAAMRGRPDGEEVLVAEYVVFASEWRCFVCRGEILEISHYQGDCLTWPDAAVIRELLAAYRPHAPAGCGIDFGVLSSGRTVLVEVNEGYSLGSYGLNAVEYSELLEARWNELMRGRIPE